MEAVPTSILPLLTLARVKENKENQCKYLLAVAQFDCVKLRFLSEAELFIYSVEL